MQRKLRLTAEDNALDYLEKCSFFIQQKGKIKWKWVIINLRQALYSFCILAIKSTNPDRVLKFDKKKKIFTNQLISFPEALIRIEDNNYMSQFVHSKIATLTYDERKHCKILNSDLRNEIEHKIFISKSWTIRLRGMPCVIDNVLRVISFLILESGNIHLSEYKKRKARGWIKIIRMNSKNFN